MDRTPFDNVNSPGEDGRGHKPWLEPAQQFEEEMVELLLQRYGLDRGNAKWLLLERCRTLTGKNMLTLDNFGRLFPEYPLHFASRWLGSSEVARMDLPRLHYRFDRTVLVRVFEEQLSEFPFGSSAVIFRWPERGSKEALVLHNFFPVNVNRPGVHTVWTDSSGDHLLLHALPVLLDCVDERHPVGEWISGADDRLRRGAAEW